LFLVVFVVVFVVIEKNNDRLFVIEIDLALGFQVFSQKRKKNVWTLTLPVK
jgi:hypothetical protein